MSTEAVVCCPGPASAAHWRADASIVRALRFGLGVWASSLLAFVVQWPLFFLTPVLVAFFLSLPLPTPTGWNAWRLFWEVLAAFALGLVFSQFLLVYPMVFVVALGLALFHSYYRLNRGGSVMFALMSLTSLLLLPMLAMSHRALSEGVANWFVLSAGLAVLTYLLAHRLLPDPDGTRGLPPGRGFTPTYSAPAARAALKSTIAVLPIALLFLALRLSGEILVIIFTAILSVSPQAAKGREAGLTSLTSTAIGGGVSIVFYALIVAVPSFWFFAVLLAITNLAFGAAIFSGRAFAPYMASAQIAMLILIGGAMGDNVAFADMLITRIVLIGLATLWVVGALWLLERWLAPPASPPDRQLLG